MKKLTIFFMFGWLIGYSQTSEIHFDLDNPDADFFQVQRNAELYFDTDPTLRSATAPDPLFKQYARWQWFWSKRIMVTSTGIGDMQYLNDAMAKYITNQNQICGNSSQSSSNWESLGPDSDPILSNTTDRGQNLGMIISLWVHPQNTNVIYAGSRFGGLFRTTNGNSGNPSWVSVTDNSRLPFQGIKSIIVIPGNGDPLDTSDDVILIASGTQAFSRAGYGMGVWKSNDGGQTWNPTGLSYSLSNKIMTHKIVKTTTGNVFYAVTEKANPHESVVYKSTDGGDNWTDLGLPSGQILWDLKIDPSDPNNVFVSGGGLFRYKNGVWKDLSYYLVRDISEKRVSITFSGNTVYALYLHHYTQNIIPNFYLINSTDGGNTWSTPIITKLTGGNSKYSMFFIEVSASNPLIIYAGNNQGVLYKSLNGGLNFNSITCYSQFYDNGNCSESSPVGSYTHADIRVMHLYSNSTDGLSDNLFIGNDGGIMKTNNGGNSWDNLNGNGLSINLFNGIGISEININLIVGGTTDNGFFTQNGGDWIVNVTRFPANVPVGDANDCVIDAKFPEFIYGNNSPGPGIAKSSNSGVTWAKVSSPCKHGDCNAQYYGAPMLMHPTNNNLYLGYHDVWYINNPSTNLISLTSIWTRLSDFTTNKGVPAGTKLIALDVAPSDPQVMYAAYDGIAFDGITYPCSPSKKIFKTTNGGSSWLDISTNFPSVCWRSVTDLVINPTNPQELWVSLGGFAENPVGSGNGVSRVYHSSDGGTNWNDYSSGLPEFPINCIVYQKGSNNGLYVGTDVGVFYREGCMAQWSCFSANLPPVFVTDLEINSATGKIVAATFGRGIWESDLATEPQTLTIDSPSQWDGETKNINGIFLNADLTIKNSAINLGGVDIPKITVNAGRSLIIDNSTLGLFCNQTRYDLEVKNGGTVIFRNTSTFTIEDNAEILIHRGGKVVIESTSQFIYKNLTSGKGIVFSGAPTADPEPFVEIRGNLTVADYANFTFTGDGFIRFGLPNNGTGASDIMTSPNSKITLIGSDRNDKIAEILDETYLLPNWDGTTGFIIKDGTILMGANARIRTANTKFVFRNASFLRLNTANHGGIGTGGCYATIDNIMVDGATRGISANLATCDGSPLIISNSIFQNCETGIYTYSKGGIFYKVKLLNNTTGWKADAPVFGSTMNNCEIKNNQTGVEYNGGAGSSLYTSSSTINNNSLYGVNVKGVSAKIRCSQITLNGTGIYVDINGTLNMGIDTDIKTVYAPYLEHDGGWVNAGNNGYTIEMYKAKSLYLKNGLNILSPAVPNTRSIVNGTIIKSNDNSTIDANYNYWKYSTSPSDGKPQSAEDYQLSRLWAEKNLLLPVQIIDPTPISSIPMCGVIPFMTYIYRDPCPGCRVITTRDFIKKRLDEAISIALKKMSEIHNGCDLSDACHGENVINDDRKAIDLFNQILMFNIPKPKPEEEELLKLAYQKMMRAISNAFLTGKMTREENSPVFSPELQMVVEVQDKLIQEANTGDTDYFKRLFVSMEKAQVLRMAGRHDVSLPLLEQTKTWVRMQEKDWVEQWECWVASEKQFYAGAISQIEFENIIPNCGIINSANSNARTVSSALNLQPENSVDNKLKGTNKSSVSKENPFQETNDNLKSTIDNTLSFQLYPNPAQGIFKVVHNYGEETPALFEISDLQGKKMLSLSIQQIETNTLLNLTLLPQGVYVYSVRSEGKLISLGRLMVMY